MKSNLKFRSIILAMLLPGVVATAQAQQAPRELTLAHNLSAERHAALQSLAERFNQGRKDYRVSVQQGPYSEAALPHMLIVEGEDSERFLSAPKPRYRPLNAVMREAKLPLRTVKPPSMLTRAAVDAKGELRALPVGLSTPVLFLNRGALAKAGLDPNAHPQTWTDLQQTLDKLFDAGSKCPYTVSQPGRVMIQNTSAWHNEPTAVMEGKTLQPSFNNMMQVKHVALMSSWYKARFLRIYDTEREAEERFAAGECAVIAASSASWPAFRRVGTLDLGIAPLPYHDDMRGAPQNTIADGASMWITAGRQPAEYKAMAAFVDFWLQPDNQVAWQRDTGYLPLNRAGVLAARSELLGPDLENVQVAVAQLTNKLATPASSATPLADSVKVTRIVDAALKEVWADAKPVKKALDDAVLLARVPVAPPAKK